MIELYHCFGARSFRAMWALEEMGIRYKLTTLPYPPGQSEDFCAKNPLKTVPLLIDGDIRLTESIAICLFLAAKAEGAKLTAKPGESEFGEWLEWIVFGETTLAYPISLMLHYGGSYEHDQFMGAPQKLDIVVDYYRDKARSGVMYLAEKLENRPYLLGARFSLADISIGYSFRLAELVGFGDLLQPVTDYWNRLKARPAFARTVDMEAASMKSSPVIR